MLPYQTHNEQGKVICQLCGKPFTVITPSHLKKVHSVTYDQYRARFGDFLASEEFTAKIKYGRVKGLLAANEKEIGEDIQIVDEPIIESDFNVSEILNVSVKDKDPMTKMRRLYLDHLRIQFANMRENYVIQEYALSGALKYEFITDFCDPVLKIIVDFPSSFFHNNDVYIDLAKNSKLKADNWMIITIPGRSPSLGEVDVQVKQAISTMRK